MRMEETSESYRISHGIALTIHFLHRLPVRAFSLALGHLVVPAWGFGRPFLALRLLRYPALPVSPFDNKRAFAVTVPGHFSSHQDH
jgi:hypothetical protein